MRIFVVLVVAIFTGPNTNAEFMDPSTNAFWDYVSKLTDMAEESLSKIRLSDLRQEIKFPASVIEVENVTMALRNNMVPLLAKITQEAKLLKVRLDQDLSTMRAQLQPYAEELSVDIQRQVEELRRDVTSYLEALDPDTLKATLLQKSEELKTGTSHLQNDNEGLKHEMDNEHFEDVQKSMMPLTQGFETQFLQPIKDLQDKVVSFGKQLGEVMTSFWEIFTK